MFKLKNFFSENKKMIPKIQIHSVLFLIIFLLILKGYGIFTAFYSFFGEQLFSFQMIAGFLWQDMIFFGGILGLTLIIVQKKYKLLKIIALIFFHIFLFLFVSDILSLILFLQRASFMETMNLLAGLNILSSVYYVLGSVVTYFFVIGLMFVFGNIIGKKIKFSKKKVFYIIFSFIAIGLLGSVISQNKIKGEGQNVCFNILQEIFITDQQEVNSNIELSGFSPEDIIKSLSRIENPEMIRQLLQYLAENSPQTIFDNYTVLQNLANKYRNINPDEILGIAAVNNNITDYENFFIDVQGSGKKHNVILIFLESYSAVDSKRVSGINDNFPLFDKIQSEGTTFTNFLSNAHTSERSHIATLQGIEPLTFFKVSDPYYTLFHGYTDSLPVFFNNKGYETYFVSSATLDFLNQRKYLQDLQFKHVFGEEVFTEKETYSFDAAPDGDLYDKILEIVDSNTGQFFIGSQTISSHEPYVTPEGNGKENMFSYVDKELYKFYKELEEREFFDDGILIMFGDHRKREDVTQAEIDSYGKSSEARILSTVIGTGITSNINENLYQHIDIFYSIKRLFGEDNVKVMKYYNDLFDNSVRREWGLKEGGVNSKFLVVDTKKTDAILQYDKGKISFRDTLNYPNGAEIIQYLNGLLKYQKNVIANVGQSNNDSIKIIAHRGDSEYFLDNTIQAFESAKNKGVDGIEFDVSYTKDGYNVVLHGPSMNNTICGIDQKIYELTLEEVRKCTLNNGETILTLNEFLEKTKDWFPLYFLELKVSNPEFAEAQTMDAIKNVLQEGMEKKVVFTSYDPMATYVFASYDNVLSSWDTDKPGDIDKIKDSRHSYFMTNFEKVTPDLMQKVELYKKSFLVYTVNDSWTMNKLYDMGVREFLTDNLDIAREWKRVKLAGEEME